MFTISMMLLKCFLCVVLMSGMMEARQIVVKKNGQHFLAVPKLSIERNIGDPQKIGKTNERKHFEEQSIFLNDRRHHHGNSETKSTKANESKIVKEEGHDYMDDEAPNLTEFNEQSESPDEEIKEIELVGDRGGRVATNSEVDYDEAFPVNALCQVISSRGAYLCHPPA